MEKSRIEWIDIAKAIGIISVVVGHISENDNIVNFVACFHMPLFMFLSGYLDEKKKSCKTKRPKYLLLRKYYLWAGLSIIYYWLIERHFRSLDITIIESMIGNAFCYLPWMNNGPLWYLWIFFIVDTTYHELQRFLSEKQILIIGLISNVLYWFLNMNELLYKVPLEIPRVLDLFVYYSIGCVSCIMETETLKKEKAFSPSTLLFIAVVNTVLVFISSTFRCFTLPGLSVITACAGILVVIIISHVVQSKLLSVIGKSSLFIMCTHIFVYRLVLGAINKFLKTSISELRGGVFGRLYNHCFNHLNLPYHQSSVYA